MLLPWANELEKVDIEAHSILTTDRIKSIISLIPDEWLVTNTDSAAAIQMVYEQFLLNRLSHSSIFLNNAQHAREALI